MRRILLNNLTWLAAPVVLFAAASGAWAAQRPIFLIFNQTADITSETGRLEREGAQIRQSIPPHILIADIPANFRLQSLVSLEKQYTGTIPLKELQSYGSLATAAGIQWNRRFVSEAKVAGFQAYGAMRADVAQKSLPAPDDLAAGADEDAIACSWAAVDGALIYKVQAARDSGFNHLLSETKTNRLQVNLPMPATHAAQPVFVRVQGIDRPEPASAEADIIGAWSKAISVDVPAREIKAGLPKPALTSPVDSYRSEGFEVNLEWLGENDQKYHLQISRSQGFERCDVDEVVPYGAYAAPTSFMHLGEIFFWRVQPALAPDQAWSDSRQFTVGAPRISVTDTFINPEAPK